MGKVRFNLNDKTKDPALIMMIYRHPKGRFKYSTGEHTGIKNWIDKKQRVRTGQINPSGKRINSKLDNYQRELDNILTELHKKGKTPTNQILKQELDRRFKGRSSDPDKITHITAYLEEAIKLKEDGNVAEATVKTYKATAKKVRGWLKNRKIHFSVLHIKDYISFADFLWDLNLKDRTVIKHLKKLSSIVELAIRDEKTSAGHNPFQLSDIGVSIPPSDQIYLSEVEIEILQVLDLHDQPKLDRIRDFLIVACYTGLRFNDIMRISPPHIIEDNNGQIIAMHTSKNNIYVEIPLKKIVRSILEKYNYSLPKISNQKANVYLKDLGKLANIDEEIIIRTFSRGTPTEEVVKKYECISTHTGRRSFVTNALLAGVAPQQVMKMTGHKNLKTFQKYIRFNERINAIQLMDHHFFTD